SLRHARHHSRGAAAYRAGVAILGVRLRDGVEGGLPAIEDRRSSGAVFERSRRAAEPHEAQRMAGALARGLDQSAGHAAVWSGLLPAASRAGAARPGAAADPAGELRPPAAGTADAVVELD